MAAEEYIRKGNHNWPIDVLSRVMREVQEEGFSELTDLELEQFDARFPAYLRRQGCEIVRLEDVDNTQVVRRI